MNIVIVKKFCILHMIWLISINDYTLAMIKHSRDVISKAVEHLNPGQTQVVTFDQPLYALAKQIQFKWPDRYGKDKLVVMFGGLHIEMAGNARNLVAGKWLG